MFSASTDCNLLSLLDFHQFVTIISPAHIPMSRLQSVTLLILVWTEIKNNTAQHISYSKPVLTIVSYLSFAKQISVKHHFLKNKDVSFLHFFDWLIGRNAGLRGYNYFMQYNVSRHCI